MAGMVGADVAELNALAAQFSASATRLRQVAQSIGHGVQTSPWRGHHADQFRSDWASSHSARLRAAADDLDGAAQSLRQNAAQQERASASDAGIGSIALYGGSSAVPLASLGPQVTSILGEMARGLGLGQSALDVEKLYRALGSPNLETLQKIARLDFHIGFGQGLKDMLHTGPFGVVGNVMTVGSLVSAYSSGDQAAILENSVDFIGSTGATMVAGPLGGVAWFVGSEIGTGIYHAGDWVAQQAGLDGLGGIAYREGARAVYGPNVDVNNLTPTQAQALCDRYDGFGGVVNSITDQTGGIAYEAGHAVAPVVDTATHIVSDAASGAAQGVGDFVSHLPKVRMPWEH